MSYGIVESALLGLLALVVLIGVLTIVIGLEMRAKKCMLSGEDYEVLRLRLRESVGVEYEPYYFLAGWRRLSFKNRSEDTNYHQCVCLAVSSRKIVVFTLWKTKGQLLIKQIHVQHKELMRYVIRKNKVELFFTVPDFRGELVVCVEPKFFSQEDWHAYNAIGIEQMASYDQFQRELQTSEAKRAPASAWVNGKLSGTNLTFMFVGLGFSAIGALFLLFFWSFVIEGGKDPVPLTTALMESGEYRNGTQVSFDTGSVLTLLYEKPETYRFYAKGGRRTDPRKLYYLMTVGSGEETRYVLLSSGEDLLFDNGSKIVRQTVGTIRSIFDSNAKKVTLSGSTRPGPDQME